MKNTRKNFPDDAWESGELGQSEDHVRKVSAEREKKIDESLDLQMISLRLQKNIIEELKALAHEEGLGYQPYIRQLLSHHVRSKKKRSRTYG